MTFAKAGSLQSALNGKSQIDKLLVLSTGSEHYRILIRLARDLVWDNGGRLTVYLAIAGEIIYANAHRYP
jgi:hypothetical protein